MDSLVPVKSTLPKLLPTNLYPESREWNKAELKKNECKYQAHYSSLSDLPQNGTLSKILQNPVNFF